MKSVSLVGNKRIVSTFFSTLILILVSSFQFNQDKMLLEGKWQALWQMKNNKAIGPKDEMRGMMDFKADGYVKIVAYGRPGCVFGSDTLKNEVKWSISNDSLRFYHHKNQFNLTYIIERYDGDEVVLRLMDDIFVTLKR